MQQNIGLSPTQIRKGNSTANNGLTLLLQYRPPYAWRNMFAFLNTRIIEGLEWGNERSYGRTIRYDDTTGYFEVCAKPD